MNGYDHVLGPAHLVHHGARAALLHGEQSVSYAALDALAARAGGALRAAGVQRGERVLILQRDTPLFAATWLGALRIGAVAVALNTRLTEAEYRHIIADSGARLVIMEDPDAPACASLAHALCAEGRLATIGIAAPAGALDWPAAVAEAEPADTIDLTPEAPAFWLYSSGTTGMPKGIRHTHASLLPAGQMEREHLHLGPGDRVLCTSKLFFSYALENGLLGPLHLGATAILHPDWADPHTVCRLVARYRPSALFSVPSFYRRLAALEDAALEPLLAVRHFCSGGERVPAALCEDWERRTGGTLLSVYGMSETFCVCMVTPPRGPSAAHGGRPLAGVDVALRAPDGGGDVGDGPGVLWLRHPALSTGYVNRDEATRELFVDGWFCTRDVFVRDAAGYYQHQGRTDDLFKVAGQWVQPGDVEEVAQRVQGVRDAVCVPVVGPDGFERLALFLVADSAAETAIRSAREACVAALPRHKLPKWIRAVAELPRTATGKMQRYKLRERLQEELRGEG